MQRVPVRGLVGVNDGASGDVRLHDGHASRFALADERQRLTIALAGDDNRLTLAFMVEAKATVQPV